nr:type II toxin-antitoxin system PemK/MazF family toxin [Leifsonia sp. C5G2]
MFRPSRAGRTAPPSSEPGRTGTTATVQVDPRRLGRIRTAYTPSLDGDADPGEIVWTWVPYEEADGRGKDRPVLVVAAEPSGAVLAVPLTSQEHPGRPEYLPIGTGEWDGRRRPSFVRLDRVYRVHQAGMRREAAALDARRFALVREALSARYRWR